MSTIKGDDHIGSVLRRPYAPWDTAVRHLWIGLFAIALMVGGAATSTAQPTPDAGTADAGTADADTTDTAPTFASGGHVTLRSWADRRRLFLFDRFHQAGDRTYDRGVFRHITPRMDREYVLDMLVYPFSVLEDDAWHRADSGMRIKAGSIERDLWAFVTQIKNRASLTPSSSVIVNAWLREDAQAFGSLLELGYEYSFSERHHLSVRHTFSQEKVDFDISARYRFVAPRWGRAMVEVTAENPYNNLIFSTLGIAAEDRDVIGVYPTPPIISRVSLQTASRRPYRAELHVGWRPAADVDFTSQTNDAFRYTDTETAHYVGATVSYRHRWLTGGLLYQRDYARLTRRGTGADVLSQYATTQRMRRYGGFVAAERGLWRGDAWYAVVDYVDEQEGTNVQLSTIDRAFRFDDDRREVRLRGFFEPSGWPFVGLEYAALIRSLDRGVDNLLTRQWKTGSFYWTGPSNYRLNFLLGYRWSRGSIATGVGFDTDNDDLPEGIPDSPGRFDNIHFRLTTLW